MDVDEFLLKYDIPKIKIEGDYESTVKKILNGFLRVKKTPLVLVDIGCLHRKVQHWKNVFSKITPFYAVKCNPNPVIVSFLGFMGLGFDCASMGEISLVLESGVPPGRIIFANPYKAVRDLKYALSNKVMRMTFDSVEELQKIYEVGKAEKCLPSLELVLRVKIATSKAISDLNAKYGCPLSDIKAIVKEVKRLELQLIGASFHVGSCCYDTKAYEEALNNSKVVFDEAKAVDLPPLRFLDIGGGFPGGTYGGFFDKTPAFTESPQKEHQEAAEQSSYPTITFEEIGNTVNSFIEKLFDDDVKVCAEPGRFFGESCQTFVAQIMARKVLDNSVNGNKNPEDNQPVQINYYMNHGVFGMFKDSFLLKSTFIPRLLPPIDAGEEHTEEAEVKVNAEEAEFSAGLNGHGLSDTKEPVINPIGQAGDHHPTYNSSFFGPTGIKIDCVMRNHEIELLPVNSSIYYPSMGAYTSSVVSPNMNSAKTKIRYVWIE